MESMISMTSVEARAAVERSRWFTSCDEDKQAHGRHWKYKSGCRCRACIEANRLHGLMYKTLARAEAREGLRQVPHGTDKGYAYYGCRCVACTAENSRTSVVRVRRWRAGVRIRATKRRREKRSVAAWTPEKRAAHAAKMRIVTAGYVPVKMDRDAAGRFRGKL